MSDKKENPDLRKNYNYNYNNNINNGFRETINSTAISNK